MSSIQYFVNWWAIPEWGPTLRVEEPPGHHKIQSQLAKWSTNQNLIAVYRSYPEVCFKSQMIVLISISAAEKSASLPADWSAWGFCYCLPVSPQHSLPHQFSLCTFHASKDDTLQEHPSSDSRVGLWCQQVHFRDQNCSMSFLLKHGYYPLRETRGKNSFSTFPVNPSTIIL